MVLRLLGEVGETREHQDADGEEHDEHPELLVAALQRVAERLRETEINVSIGNPTTCNIQVIST